MAQFAYSFAGGLDFICTDHAIQTDSETAFMVKLIQYCADGGSGTPDLTYLLVNQDTNEVFTGHEPEVSKTYSSTADEVWYYNVPAGTWYLYIQANSDNCTGGNRGIAINGYVNSSVGTVVSRTATCTAH